MEVALSIPLRVAYTQYKRRQNAKDTHPMACNALVHTSGEQTLAPLYLLEPPNAKDNLRSLNSSTTSLPPAYDYLENEKSPQVTTSLHRNSTSTSSSKSTTSAREFSPDPASTSHSSTNLTTTLLTTPTPIAILPQYTTATATTLTITESTFPHLASNFTVTPKATQTQPSPLLTIRRPRAQISQSHSITDPKDTRVAEIQRGFSAPGAGSRATLVFTNACDGRKTKAAVHGRWKNRRAEIRLVGDDGEAEGQVLASMSSEWFTLRNMLGSRRDYEVQVAARVDVVLVVASIMALDARAS